MTTAKNLRYHMRAFDSGDTAFKRWVVDGESDPFALQAPTPVGTYSDIVVEKTLPQESMYEPWIHRWNGVVTSPFTQVLGNGIGGVGVAGDWTLTAGTFPNDEAPALAITNVNAVSGAAPAADAIWLFNDFEGGLPERFYAGWRNTWITSNACDIGVIPYYEDNDHYFLVWRNSGTAYSLYGKNGSGFYTNQQISQVADADAQRDTTFGDIMGCTGWYRKARRNEGPAITLKAGGPFTPSYSGTGGVAKKIFTRAHAGSGADASWDTLSRYRPRIGIFVRGGGVSDTDYIGGLTFFRAYGGV
jgi:hypothetical protein